MAHRYLHCAFAVVSIGCINNSGTVLSSSGTGGAKGNAGQTGTGGVIGAGVIVGAGGVFGASGVLADIRLDANLVASGGDDASMEVGQVEARGPTSGVPGQLVMVVRDFKLYDPSDSSTNSDFENVPATDDTGAPSTTYSGPWDDKEIVATILGTDFKPVYKSPAGTTLTTHGKAAFDQWYRTVDGTNIAQQIPLTLTQGADGTYAYDSVTAGPPLSPGEGFFPIDDGTPYATTFGNQGEPHNYSFTVEIHTLFTYQGGEVFNFSGDDDVFVYVNNQLVINLGGIHAREPASVSLDSLGLTKGQTYPLDFFSAERHVVQSNLLITTTLELSANPDIPIY